MADFSIISDVSNEVLKLLRENICPGADQSPEPLPLRHPDQTRMQIFSWDCISMIFRNCGSIRIWI